MHSSQVSFRTIDADVTDVATGEKKQPMDIIEIRYPDGKVSAFPAESVSPETGRKYSEMYGNKYQAFKSGEPDTDRVKVLEREIAERQAELDGLGNRPQGDKRVQENLGYGEADHHKPFDHMTKAEINDWIAKNSDETPPSDASKDNLVKLAKKVERKQKAAA